MKLNDNELYQNAADALVLAVVDEEYIKNVWDKFQQNVRMWASGNKDNCDIFLITKVEQCLGVSLAQADFFRAELDNYRQAKYGEDGNVPWDETPFSKASLLKFAIEEFKNSILHFLQEWGEQEIKKKMNQILKERYGYSKKEIEKIHKNTYRIWANLIF